MICRTADPEFAIHRWLGLFLGGLALAATVQAQPASEYQVKAVFLYNFARFVEWPPRAFAGPQSPLIIGVLGEDPFGSYLDEVVARETADRRPLVVQRFRRLDEIRACPILFISRSENRRLEQVFARLEGRSILTVGDTDDFAFRGGIIRFRSVRNRIRFRINLAAARAASLVISSKVLRSADVIAPAKARG